MALGVGGLKPIFIFLGFVGTGLGGIFVMRQINRNSGIGQKLNISGDFYGSSDDSPTAKDSYTPICNKQENNAVQVTQKENCKEPEDEFLRRLRAWD